MAAASSSKKAEESFHVNIFTNYRHHLYYGCPVTVGGSTYPSGQHAWYASMYKDHLRWACGGEFSRFKELVADINEERLWLGQQGNDYKETITNLSLIHI